MDSQIGHHKQDAGNSEKKKARMEEVDDRIVVITIKVDHNRLKY